MEKEEIFAGVGELVPSNLMPIDALNVSNRAFKIIRIIMTFFVDMFKKKDHVHFM